MNTRSRLEGKKGATSANDRLNTKWKPLRILDLDLKVRNEQHLRMTNRNRKPNERNTKKLHLDVKIQNLSNWAESVWRSSRPSFSLGESSVSYEKLSSHDLPLAITITDFRKAIGNFSEDLPRMCLPQIELTEFLKFTENWHPCVIEIYGDISLQKGECSLSLDHKLGVQVNKSCFFFKEIQIDNLYDHWSTYE